MQLCYLAPTLMQSMTGHGRATDSSGAVTIELRTVNHRHLDIKLNVAMFSAALEEVVTRELRRQLHRGALTLNLSVASTATSNDANGLDTDRAVAVFQELVTLARTLGTEPPTLAMVVANPLVWRARAAPVDAAKLEGAVLEALAQALAALVAMRQTEGAALRADVAGRLQQLRQEAAAIHLLAADVPALLRQRLLDRLNKISDMPVPVDPSRLAQEVVFHVDRADISEEVARLQSHFEQVETALDANEPVGRRLDFLVQEIGRELSTIGAKSASAEISHHVVAAKTVLEKLREQVQNVE